MMLTCRLTMTAALLVAVIAAGPQKGSPRSTPSAACTAAACTACVKGSATKCATCATGYALLEAGTCSQTCPQGQSWQQRGSGKGAACAKCPADSMCPGGAEKAALSIPCPANSKPTPNAASCACAANFNTKNTTESRAGIVCTQERWQVLGCGAATKETAVLGQSWLSADGASCQCGDGMEMRGRAHAACVCKAGHFSTGGGCEMCSSGHASLGGFKPSELVPCIACGASIGKARSGVSYSTPDRTACMCSRGFTIDPKDFTKCLPDPTGACDCSDKPASELDEGNGACYTGTSPCTEAPAGFTVVENLCAKRGDGSFYRIFLPTRGAGCDGVVKCASDADCPTDALCVVNKCPGGKSCFLVQNEQTCKQAVEAKTEGGAASSP